MHDVIVVGAGVIGASVAWHLGRLGVRTLLLEREGAPGQGSTGRATGGFRAQFGTEINVRLSLLAREKLRRFEEETGVDPGYAPRGYLSLAQSEAQLTTLRDAQKHVFKFPALTLTAGSSVRIHTGHGSNAAHNLYWGSGSYIWNNTGDKATLKNKAGTVMDTCSWGSGAGVVSC